jgi:hypothetical protein
MLATEGETVTLIAVIPGLTVTTALAVLVLSAALAARTVTLVGLVTLGATKLPSLLIDPALADQTTAVLLVPCTLAENF